MLYDSCEVNKIRQLLSAEQTLESATVLDYVLEEMSTKTRSSILGNELHLTYARICSAKSKHG